MIVIFDDNQDIAEGLENELATMRGSSHGIYIVNYLAEGGRMKLPVDVAAECMKLLRAHWTRNKQRLALIVDLSATPDETPDLRYGLGVVWHIARSVGNNRTVRHLLMDSEVLVVLTTKWDLLRRSDLEAMWKLTMRNVDFREGKDWHEFEIPVVRQKPLVFFALLPQMRELMEERVVEWERSESEHTPE
jgi:hypothetical protein